MTPRLADRYIFKQLLDYFLMGVVVFTLVAFFSDTLLNLIREIQKYGIPFSTLSTIIGLQLPKSVALVLPPAAFLAVLMVFNQLNNHFEIISMRMNGISLWRLTVPALVLGLLCSGLTYLLSDYVVPWCNAKTDQIKKQVMQSGTLPAGSGSFMHRDYDEKHNLMRLVYISHYTGRKLSDSTVIDLSKPKVMQIVQSRSGFWHPGQGWEFINANVYLVSEDVRHSSAAHFSSLLHQGLMNSKKTEEKIQEEHRSEEQGIKVKTDSQSFAKVLSIIKKREALGKRVARSNYLDMWQKITWPLSCLVIILSAIPLSMSPPRTGSNRGFVFSLIVLFLMYMLRNVFIGMGQNFYNDLGGLLSMPVYLAIISWLPLLVLTLVGVLLIHRKSYVL